jgi:hypothetical protein
MRPTPWDRSGFQPAGPGILPGPFSRGTVSAFRKMLFDLLCNLSVRLACCAASATSAVPGRIPALPDLLLAATRGYTIR